MEIADRQQALEAALAQIDRAFGKEGAEARRAEMVKVWTDPFTEQLVLDYVRRIVDGYLMDDDGCLPYHDDFWYDIESELERGEHRVIRHPFDRMYPPVTIGERLDLFIRRIMGWFQRAKD